MRVKHTGEGGGTLLETPSRRQQRGGSPDVSNRAAPERQRSLRLVPLIGQLRDYRTEWLRGDLVAGVVVAALIIPKNLGYAGIAGVPLESWPGS